MSAFCNNILYLDNAKDSLEITCLLGRLESYMMVCNNLQKEIIKDTQLLGEKLSPVSSTSPLLTITSSPFPSRPISLPLVKTKDTHTTNDFFQPKQQDTLFWCLYSAHYGHNDYTQVERNYGVKELEIKQQVADQIKSNKIQLSNTNYKITKVATQEILSDLLTSQKETNVYCLLAIIAFFNINILMIDHTERFLLEFVADTTSPETPTFLIKKTIQNRYSIRLDPLTATEKEVLNNNKIHLVNSFKPMKILSAYKVAELEELAIKLGIPEDARKGKKNELYEKLQDIIKI